MKLFTGSRSGIRLDDGCIAVNDVEIAVNPQLQGQGEVLYRADLQEAGGLSLTAPSSADNEPALLLLRECIVGFDLVNFEPHNLVPSCGKCRVKLFGSSAQAHSIHYSPSWCVVSSVEALVVLEPGSFVDLHIETSSGLTWFDLLLKLIGSDHKRKITTERIRFSFDGSKVMRQELPALISVAA
jgi:hypothetical protein